MNELPEDCKLIAVHDGAGDSATWTLTVENANGDVVAYLQWPTAWSKWITARELKEHGFEVYKA